MNTPFRLEAGDESVPATAMPAQHCDGMIPLAVPDLSGREGEYLQECIDSTFVSSVGPFVERFESMVAALSGAREAVATSSGTCALHAALMAVGVERDDLVILPTYTFIASANSIAHCGAMPWLMDIDAASWTLDPLLLEGALANETRRKDGGLMHVASGKRVAAIMPVHTLGIPADMPRIRAIAADYDLPVVADGAAALGATCSGRALGGLADLTVYSFNGNKTVTAGGGGAVVGNDPALVRLVRHLTTTARVGRDYVHDRVGYNYRMTNLNAAVGCAQLERADALIAAKRRTHAIYDDAFRDIKGVECFPRPTGRESACWFSGILLVGDHLPKVSALCEQLGEQGIEGRPFWRPMHLQACFNSAPGGPFPISNRIHTRILTLPCSTHLSSSDQSHVIAAVRGLLT